MWKNEKMMKVWIMTYIIWKMKEINVIMKEKWRERNKIIENMKNEEKVIK